VQGNLIGTKITGEEALMNKGSGVELRNTSSNTIGGNNAHYRNVVSGNGDHGILIGSGTARNYVLGNSIGINAEGTMPIANAKSGVFIQDSFENLIGGNKQVARNMIAANTLYGVEIHGALATKNDLWRNTIGSPTLAFLGGNREGGVFISDDAHDNNVGGIGNGKHDSL
jgi:parallel beta-helix repeat protein